MKLIFNENFLLVQIQLLVYTYKLKFRKTLRYECGLKTSDFTLPPC